MNRKDDNRYTVAPYLVDAEGISEEGHVCDERHKENIVFRQWITKEVSELKTLLQKFCELAVEHGQA